MVLPYRIVRRIEVTDGCWLWHGTTQSNGYGYTRWRLRNGEWGNARVHRLMYEDAVGDIPDGYEIDHICKVRNCVNPTHLRAVTHAENLLTRNHRGPTRSVACKAGHTWTDETTRVDKHGQRTCKICFALYKQAWRNRRRANGLKPS
jgi:hypothetical protein